MLFKTISASVYGIDAYLVQVEVHVGSAYMKDFNVVGLPDNAVREPRTHQERAEKLRLRIPVWARRDHQFGSGGCEKGRVGV
jgi:hypothetical protein